MKIKNIQQTLTDLCVYYSQRSVGHTTLATTGAKMYNRKFFRIGLHRDQFLNTDHYCPNAVLIDLDQLSEYTVGRHFPAIIDNAVLFEIFLASLNEIKLLRMEKKVSKKEISLQRNIIDMLNERLEAFMKKSFFERLKYLITGRV